MAEKKQVQHLTYTTTLAVAGAVGSGAKISIRAPFPGKLTDVYLFLDSGPHGLVGVAVSHSNVQFLPRQEDTNYLFITNIFAQFAVYEEIKSDEQIVVDMTNGDAANIHQVTVIVRLES